MRPLILLLAAMALIGAAPPWPPAHFEGSGFEPSWVLTINGNRMTYDTGTSEPSFTIRSPRWRPVRNGYRYVSSGMIVEILRVRCEAYGGRIYTHTVNVTLGSRFGDGCGGAFLPPPTLDYGGWRILSIGGSNLRQPNGSEFYISFEDGRVSGMIGCGDLSGTYRERRPILTFGPATVTRRDCPAAQMAYERRALRVLRGPMRMRFVDGDTLILTGAGGTARLQP